VSDTAIRELERRWVASGVVQDRAAWEAALVRTGEPSREDAYTWLLDTLVARVHRIARLEWLDMGEDDEGWMFTTLWDYIRIGPSAVSPELRETFRRGLEPVEQFADG